MATFENTVMIRRPIADVFAFLADFENIPKWNYAIVETHKVSQGPIGVGTIYQQVRSGPSRGAPTPKKPGGCRSRSKDPSETPPPTPPRQLELQAQLGPFPSRLSYA